MSWTDLLKTIILLLVVYVLSSTITVTALKTYWSSKKEFLENTWQYRQ